MIVDDTREFCLSGLPCHRMCVRRKEEGGGYRWRGRTEPVNGNERRTGLERRRGGVEGRGGGEGYTHRHRHTRVLSVGLHVISG
jgi:hypothetical protein